ncbi:MAG TPA: hypothetical protein VLA19_08580 [Herpetosiphonaceae bacterium]|nr:hypothetical protein [Herpetosiphonaceae bacterium]
MRNQDELEGKGGEVGQGEDTEGYARIARQAEGGQGDLGEGRALDEVNAGEAGSGEGDDTEGFIHRNMRSHDQEPDGKISLP